MKYSNDPKNQWNLAIMGDFNFPFVSDWNAPNQFQNTADREKLQSVSLSNLAAEFHLTQVIDFPTRKSNTLDLIFVSDPDLILNCEREVNVVISDHDNIDVTLAFVEHEDIVNWKVDTECFTFSDHKLITMKL